VRPVSAAIAGNGRVDAREVGRRSEAEEMAAYYMLRGAMDAGSPAETEIEQRVYVQLNLDLKWAATQARRLFQDEVSTEPRSQALAQADRSMRSSFWRFLEPATRLEDCQPQAPDGPRRARQHRYSQYCHVLPYIALSPLPLGLIPQLHR
jgi:hypothetical protein